MLTVKRHAKKPFFQELVIYFPVFSNYKVTVLLCEQPIVAGRYVADRDYLSEPPTSVSESDAFTKTSDYGYATIHLRPNSPIGDIAHESYHAISGLMRWLGAKHEDEVIAYHLGYLVDKIVEFKARVAPRFDRKKKEK